MYKLLIADDEAKIRNGLVNYFPWNQEGFDVVCECSDGRQVIACLECTDVDVLLLDIVMPHVSGLDVVKYIAEKKLPVKVIILSAHREFDYAQKCLRLGVQDYVLKPTKYDELVEVFRKVRVELDDQRNSSADRETQALDITEQIKALVHGNYQSITLEDISDKLHMNTSYISRMFKKRAAISFSDYLTQVRMEKACDLLGRPGILIYEVCSLVGYTEPRSFSKAFKRQYGITPREYKAKISGDS